MKDFDFETGLVSKSEPIECEGPFDEERLRREVGEYVREADEENDALARVVRRGGPRIERKLAFEEVDLRRERAQYVREPDRVNDELAFEVWKWRCKEYGPSGERSPAQGGRIPGGLVGYEERKGQDLFEAARDREAAELAAAPEKERLEKIEQVAKRYPQVRIREIAERVVPWDEDVFKRLAALAVAEYKKSLLS